MRMPAFIRLTIRNIVVNTDLGTMIFMLGLPTLYLFVMGFMFQGITPGGLSIRSGGPTIQYTTFLAPGIIALQAFTAGNIGGGMLWSDRRWGMFEQIMVGPFERFEYLLGIVFVSIFFALVGSLIMLGFALTIPVVFNYSLMGVVAFIFTIITGTILFSSLFLIISGIAKSMQAYQTITIVLFFLLDFASTAFYPETNSTPLWLQVISDLNPLTYISNVLRDSFIYGVSTTTFISMGMIFVVMMVLFVISMFVYRNIRSGI